MNNKKYVQMDLKIDLPFFTDENPEFDDKRINEICNEFNTFFKKTPGAYIINGDKYEIKATPAEFQTKYYDVQKGIEFSFKGNMTVDVTPGCRATPEEPACNPDWVYTSLDEFKEIIKWASKQINLERTFNDFSMYDTLECSDTTLWGYSDISEEDYDKYIQSYYDYEYGRDDLDDR